MPLIITFFIGIIISSNIKSKSSLLILIGCLILFAFSSMLYIDSFHLSHSLSEEYDINYSTNKIFYENLNLIKNNITK
jgi:hypothetical protein